MKDICEHYGKPFLVLQLDEHASDVGYTTRLEAGLRSFPTTCAEAEGRPVQPEPSPARARTITSCPATPCWCRTWTA